MKKASHRSCVRLAVLLGIALACAACSSQTFRRSQSESDAKLQSQLTRLIKHEMAIQKLPALSIALVNDQQTIWAKGFGYQDPDHKTPATARTVYRVGSVSKLFTDVAIMRLVERGQLDLDAPVTKYLPNFRPRNPFGKPITLRELMCHRSGLVREAPVGNYFDSSSPSIDATVRSLNETELVYPPGEHTKYSNAGVTVAGYVLQTIERKPFAEYLKDAVLRPLGMNDSAFQPEPRTASRLAKAYMWTYDGRVFEAPSFQLGTQPAGSLYTTVLDLARFESALFAGGRGVGGHILRPQTLENMWVPQFTLADQKSGFGLGFYISQLDGHRMAGHGGAIYGFATELDMLPDDKLGAVVITTKDCANGVAGHIAEEALRLMLARQAHRPLPQVPLSEPVPPEEAQRLAGVYGQGEAGVRLSDEEGQLSMVRNEGGNRLELRQTGKDFIADDKLSYGPPIQILPDAMRVDGQTLKRQPDAKPAPAEKSWQGLIGEYGWDYDTLYILERGGHLTALIEWFFYNPLQQLSGNVFKFPSHGLYDGERLTFKRDAQGRATAAQVGWVVFKRRPLGPEEGKVFRIHPVKPVDELRREALAAEPPKGGGPFLKPDLVDVTRLDPSIKLDIRYATSNNFLGTPVYQKAKAFMQRPAAEALARASRALRRRGYGLLIHDAYRPWYVTKIFWDATPADKKIFVADPSHGSRHNRGCAVDLTLYDRKTGREVPMVSGYDEMTERAFPFYPGGTSLERWDRRLLRQAMESQGFTVYEYEWWHFDYRDWQKYPVMNVPFGQLQTRRASSPHAR
ncbi:MAG TPA: serine hydrolase [Terriglobia bacterium]|nr:serine hydrolase [Terriglobia bacterium]